MSARARPGRLTRGLRFRLTVSYALFFTILLALIGFLFRQTLIESLDSQLQEVLEQEWAAMKGYLRIEKNQPHLVLRRQGSRRSHHRSGGCSGLPDHRRAWECSSNPSDTYRGIGIDPPEEITRVSRSRSPSWRTRSNSQGAPFLIRSGVVYDETTASVLRRHRTPAGANNISCSSILPGSTWP